MRGREIVAGAAAVVSGLAGAADAANVYVLSSGDITTDQAVMAALTSHGHTATLGVQYGLFDGGVNLSGFQAVFLQCSSNWSSGALMPAAGQQQLLAWVNAGGRLVTGEWVIYNSFSLGSKFEHLGPILPTEHTFTYGSAAGTTYTQVTADPQLNAGLPAQFSFPLTSFAGTEIYAIARPTAREYYSTSSSPGAAGLAGWTVGQGFVFSFTSTCGADQVGDPNFGRLLANAMGPSGAVPCYANCDGSTVAPVLNVSDFVCFQTRYAAGDTYANCDGSSVQPVLNVSDFICFQTRFAGGCS